jgi:hypothetical protein
VGADTYDYDLMAGPPQLKLVVKTKKASGVPQPHFDNTVNCANARQQADAYVFLRVIWSHLPSTSRVLFALPCDCYEVRVDQCGLHCWQPLAPP